MKFRKKPVIIDAWQWDESKATLSKTGAKRTSCRGHRDRPDECTDLRIDTLEGSMRVDRGDWIIRGVKGEFYPCKPDIFEATYEAADSREASTSLPCSQCRNVEGKQHAGQQCWDDPCTELHDWISSQLPPYTDKQ
jgi:hypothetical protein